LAASAKKQGGDRTLIRDPKALPDTRYPSDHGVFSPLTPDVGDVMLASASGLPATKGDSEAGA
jgi:hypothetical protein